MSSETNAISKLKKLLESNYVIEKVQPPVMASDAEDTEEIKKKRNNKSL